MSLDGYNMSGKIGGGNRFLNPSKEIQFYGLHEEFIDSQI